MPLLGADLPWLGTHIDYRAVDSHDPILHSFGAEDCHIREAQLLYLGGLPY